MCASIIWAANYFPGGLIFCKLINFLSIAFQQNMAIAIMKTSTTRLPFLNTFKCLSYHKKGHLKVFSAITNVSRNAQKQHCDNCDKQSCENPVFNGGCSQDFLYDLQFHVISTAFSRVFLVLVRLITPCCFAVFIIISIL